VPDLENKVAVVTGGATGLGKAYALRLASEGANVAVWDINLEGAEATARAVEEKGRKSLARRADISSPDDTREAAKATFDAFGRIDILVNNAGLMRGLAPRGTIEEVDFAEWNRVMQININGTMLATKAVVPYMKQSEKGKIINISSGTALHGWLGGHAYITSKSALIGLTRVLAVELGEHGINVNAVTPGPVDIAPVTGGEPMPLTDAMLAGRAIKRRIVPRDLEGVIAFLASDDSDIITGQVINADAGRVFIA
jgi:NAD(P)-dependent dehydrogenase (short-subunit alcohol dehydrogenase family)